MKNSELEESIAKLRKQMYTLKLTRPYSPSLDEKTEIDRVRQLQLYCFYIQVPRSGKSASELEGVIVKMKKVLDRTLAENKRMKQTPGVDVQEELRRLREDNLKLKQHLDEAERAAGATLAERRLESEKSLSRLTIEYDRLRGALLKVSCVYFEV